MNTDSRLNRLLTAFLLVIWSILGLMIMLSFAIPFEKPIVDFMTLTGAIGLGLLLVMLISRRKNVIH